MHTKNHQQLRQFLRRQTRRKKSLKQASDKEAESALRGTAPHIFDTQKMKALAQEHGNKSNLYRNHQRFIAYLGNTDGFLALATVPCSVAEKLDDLQLDFPNFSEVIGYYREQIALSQLTPECTFSATPLLISGPPGVGKTAFCKALAHIIETPFEWIGMSGVTAGFVLGGMSSNWSDGKPGKIVESLARGHKANPIILVDEIDKIGGDHRYDPLGALYQLLERATAINFIDEGLETPVNCEYIIWVATANRLEYIPEPILSRFAVIEVQQPSYSQMKKVLQSIYKKIRREHNWGKIFAEQLPENVVEKVMASGLPPRLIQRELICACGRAALTKPRSNSYYELSPDNFQPRLTGEKVIRIGFV